jgi:hypothetical protein
MQGPRLFKLNLSPTLKICFSNSEDLVNDVNLLGYNIDTIKRNTQTLIDASKSRSKHKENYMLLSRHQNAGQNHGIKTADDVLKMSHSSDI